MHVELYNDEDIGFIIENKYTENIIKNQEVIL